MKTYLLTGGTGFLGSLFSIELIKKRDKVIFLGRAKDDKSFEQRIKEKLQSIEPNISLNNLEIVEINLHKENLGISNGYTDRFSGKIDAIWHLAANLSFKEKDKEKIFNTNIDGLKNILNLARKIEAPIFYISTAYVHGQRPGIIFEDELIKPKH
ncbi:MAG: SDR family oxidoreductase, partial [Patescibacteria group bacterium]